MTQDSTLDLLRACDTAPAGSLTGPGVDDALEEIGRAIVSRPRPRCRRRRVAAPRRIVLIAAALVLLAGGVTGARTLFVPTHTGTYAPKWAVTGAGPGEILNTTGTDFHRIAIRLSADIPFPFGFLGWRDYVLAMEVKTQTWHRVPSGQLRGEYAMAAICAWVVDWRAATLSGEEARAAHDAGVLAGALRWRAVTAWDPHPSTAVPGDMNTTHPSTFGWAIPYIAAIRAGDRAKLDRLLTDERFEGSFFVHDPGFNAWQQKTRRPIPDSYLSWLIGGARK